MPDNRTKVAIVIKDGEVKLFAQKRGLPLLERLAFFYVGPDAFGDDEAVSLDVDWWTECPASVKTAISELE